jgi:hypothetical protein
VLASLDYPDGMTGGLRRTTAVARALAERGGSDLTKTMVSGATAGRSPPFARDEAHGFGSFVPIGVRQYGASL